MSSPTCPICGKKAFRQQTQYGIRQKKNQEKPLICHRKIAEIARSNGEFLCTLSYRDDKLRDRCEDMVSGGVLKREKRVHHGSRLYHLSDRFISLWNQHGERIFNYKHWYFLLGLRHVDYMLMKFADVEMVDHFGDSVLAGAEVHSSRRWLRAYTRAKQRGWIRRDKRTRVVKLTQAGSDILSAVADLELRF